VRAGETEDRPRYGAKEVIRNRRTPTAGRSAHWLSVVLFAALACGRHQVSLPPVRANGTSQLETYILPAGYRGGIVVVYADSGGVRGEPRITGQPPTRSIVERIYRIPVGGFIRVQDDYPPESARARFVINSIDWEEITIWPNCSGFGDKIRGSDARQGGCWLPHIASSMVHPIPFYVAAVVTDSAHLRTHYSRTVQLIADSVFRGRIMIPEVLRIPPKLLPN
jgi:hypothetical protein